METARHKLCKSQEFDPWRPMQSLAVLGARFCLDAHFGHHRTAAYQRKSVSGYLRVCTETTEDRIWQSTMYASEPLVACAASELLHEKLDNIKNSLRRLTDEISNGLIDIGKRGELASRVILLLAKDLCVRQPNLLPPNPEYTAWQVELLDCRPLPVVKYLEFLFGADNPKLDKMMKDLFRDWHIDFSHWISMDENIRVGFKDHLRYVSCQRLWTSYRINTYPRAAWRIGSPGTNTVPRPYSAATASLISIR